MVKTFACSFTATNLDARSGITSVVEELRSLGVPGPRVDEVQIALTEAVNNVVEHAYAGSAPGDVRIRGELHPERLWISIQDAGRPFRPASCLKVDQLTWMCRSKICPKAALAGS